MNSSPFKQYDRRLSGRTILSMLARTCFITGGAISVIGGMLFVIIVLLHLLKGKARTN